MTSPASTSAPAAGRDVSRKVLGQFATGVTVVTAGRRDPRGMTANSFTSVSLDPPLVLVCVSRIAAVHTAILAEGGFALSILSADQEHLARYFADHRRPRGADEFEAVEAFCGRSTGAPLLAGALAWLECSVTAVHDGGDHSILLGSVLDLARGEPGEPLVFFDSGFHHPPAGARRIIP